MFEKLLSSATALRRHQDGPLVAERERYLQHCSDTGATYGSMRIKCNELLWAARLLDGDAKDGFDMEGLEALADRRMAFQSARTTRRRFIDVTRPWFRGILASAIPRAHQHTQAYRLFPRKITDSYLPSDLENCRLRHLQENIYELI
jgi:hypothetical protein